ncbi:MAG: NUDIX hydrolase N-terminal domain-containing protein [Acidimicrobiia bacterium]
MDLLHVLDEVQAIARTGLTYATDSYDRERYERLLTMAVDGYAEALSLPPEAVRARLARDLGYVTAKVGADAAIFDDSDRIFLVQRADDHCWGLVSGWVDAGESPADTVVREVQEEVGLVARIDALVDVFGRQASTQNGPHGAVAVVYLCSVEPGDPTLTHEVLDARYWDIEAVEPWHKNHLDYARASLAFRARGR